MVAKLLRRSAIAGFALLSLEAAYAVLRPAPILQQFDLSAEFGDPWSPPLRMVVLGDSSVTAPGVSRPDEIWVSLICQRIAETRHVLLRSLAVGGATALDLIIDQLDEAIAFQPDLALVSVGANDAIKGVPLRRFTSELDVVTGELAATGAKVILSGVGVLGTIPRLYPPLSTLMSRRAERFDRVHWEVARRHGAAVIDHRSDDHRIWYTDRSLWAEDLFHVSAAGHARWAETAWRTVGPLVNGSDGPG